MFKSIKYISYLKKENDLYFYLYKIIDDDFEVEYIGATSAPMAASAVASAAATAIINCYYSINLNVAKNFIIFMKYYQEKYYLCIEKQILWYKQYTTDFGKYLPEIEKYINLL